MFNRHRWSVFNRRQHATLSDTMETTLEWAKTMTWKEISPVTKLVETAYQKGVRLGKKAFNALAKRIDRNTALPKNHVTIQPQA
ncbi:MAG: hypothetical protein PHO08_13760 [Methylococcales bacterium]|nr:hypothetical protein [Methylococcales bacterium]MDD5633637.1 hypothetical protein [Methylococcales bacterium]